LIGALQVCGGAAGRLRLLDPYWFVARDDAGRKNADRRAALIAEM
jgi:hypothetical protein